MKPFVRVSINATLFSVVHYLVLLGLVPSAHAGPAFDQEFYTTNGTDNEAGPVLAVNMHLSSESSNGINELLLGRPSFGQARGAIQLQASAESQGPAGATGSNLLPPSGGNQVSNIVIQGQNTVGKFGMGVAVIPDRNGDGVQEVAVSAPFTQSGSHLKHFVGIFNLRAWLANTTSPRSYADADRVFWLELPSGIDAAAVDFGYALAAWEEKLAVGSPRVTQNTNPSNQSRVDIFNVSNCSPNQACLPTQSLTLPQGIDQNSNFGFVLTWVRDLTGDGAPDLVVGAPYGPQGGRVVVYRSENNFGTPWIIQSPNSVPNGQFGFALADAGQISLHADGSKSSGVLIGARREGPAAAVGRGNVYLYKLNNSTPPTGLEVVQTFTGSQQNGAMGTSVGTLGLTGPSQGPATQLGLVMGEPLGAGQAGSSRGSVKFYAGDCDPNLAEPCPHADTRTREDFQGSQSLYGERIATLANNSTGNIGGNSASEVVVVEPSVNAGGQAIGMRVEAFSATYPIPLNNNADQARSAQVGAACDVVHNQGQSNQMPWVAPFLSVPRQWYSSSCTGQNCNKMTIEVSSAYPGTQVRCRLGRRDATPAQTPYNCRKNIVPPSSGTWSDFNEILLTTNSTPVVPGVYAFSPTLTEGDVGKIKFVQCRLEGANGNTFTEDQAPYSALFAFSIGRCPAGQTC
jgi:hypothetical protein